MLLLAIIAASTEEQSLRFSRSIKIEGYLLDWVFKHHRKVTPNGTRPGWGRSGRELGF